MAELSCECSDHDETGWYYYAPECYSVLQVQSLCCSCGDVIASASTTVEFKRMESDDRGDEFALDSFFMCERCGDIYFSLEELGFCINLGDAMLELLGQYQEVYGSQKKGIV